MDHNGPAEDEKEGSFVFPFGPSLCRLSFVSRSPFERGSGIMKRSHEDDAAASGEQAPGPAPAAEGEGGDDAAQKMRLEDRSSYE